MKKFTSIIVLGAVLHLGICFADEYTKDEDKLVVESSEIGTGYSFWRQPNADGTLGGGE